MKERGWIYSVWLCGVLLYEMVGGINITRGGVPFLAVEIDAF